MREANIDIQTRILSLTAFQFFGSDSTMTWNMYNTGLHSASNTIALTAVAGVNLPNGCIITSFKAHWTRDDASATGTISLYRSDFTGTSNAMASADSDSTAGDHTVEDTSISYATINNADYSYGIEIVLDPNDDWHDVALYAVTITYTIIKALP